MKVTLLFLLVSALAACGSMTQRLAEGQPPEYQQGLEDGCSSGRKAIGGLISDWRKDEKVYVANLTYRSGWDHGFTFCTR